MRKDFLLTEKSNTITLKIAKSLLIVVIVLYFIMIFKNHASKLSYMLLALGIVGLILLHYIRSYKVIGKIIFETNRIVIEKNNQPKQLPFQMISGIKFILHGQKRRSYLPITYAPIGMNMADGTGNFILIETEENNYKLDVFLQNSWDENSLEFQIKRLADSGLKVDKRKLPAILGDSI